MEPVGEEKPSSMSTSEAGRKGGSVVRDKYGEDYYRRIGKKGGNTTKERQDADFYSRIGKMGGTAKRQKKTN